MRTPQPPRGITPLLYAALDGNVSMAERLIAAGVDVNEPGGDGTQALPYAIAAGQDAFAMFLLEQGADPNSSMAGIRALHAAAGSVYYWLGDWSRRHGYGGSYLRGGFSRVTLPPERRLPLVRALLERGADPNARITTSAMFMTYIGYPTKGAFEPFACGTGDLRGATPALGGRLHRQRGRVPGRAPATPRRTPRSSAPCSTRGATST